MFTPTNGGLAFHPIQEIFFLKIGWVERNEPILPKLFRWRSITDLSLYMILEDNALSNSKIVYLQRQKRGNFR